MGSQRAVVCMLFLLPLLAGCGNPPAATPPPSPVAGPPAAPSTPAAPPPAASPTAAVTAAPAAVLMPAIRPEPAPTVEEKNAADLAALKAVLERGAQGAVRAAVPEEEPRRQDVPAETLSESELAAAREALPGLQDRLQQMIPRNFDGETFRRLLTTHPEFRKD